MDIEQLQLITKALLELLRQHHTVVIPDFGGFTGVYESAVVDHLSGLTRPPSLRVAFNPDLKVNDGRLSGYLAEQNGWTEEEAERYVAGFVEQAQRLLSERKLIEFKGLGTLYVDFDKRYRFVQESENLNQEAFGLPQVATPLVATDQKKPRAVSDLSSAQAEKPEIDSSVEVKQEEEVEVKIPKEKRMQGGLWWQSSIPWIILMSLIILLVSGYFLRKQYRLRKAAPADDVSMASDRVNVPPAASAVEEAEGELLFADEEEDLADMAAEEQLPLSEEEGIEEEEREVPALPPGLQEGVIIIGSFSSEKNAERLIQRLYEDGYDAYSDRRSGRTRVGIRFAYKGEAELMDYLEQMKNKYNVDAWILVQ